MIVSARRFGFLPNAAFGFSDQTQPLLLCSMINGGQRV